MTNARRFLDGLEQASIWTLVGWAGLAFTFLFTIFKLPYFLAPGIASVSREIGQHLYVLVWMLVLTSFNRTIRLRTLLAFWFIGIYPAFALAVLVGRPMAALFGLNGHFVPDFWVPLTEELIKALPVLLYLAWSSWKVPWQTSATDGLLLGLAVGSGFAIHEDIVDQRVGGSGIGSGSPLTLFFPTAWVNSSHTLFILGHAGWTALIGLALGFAFLLRRMRLVWIVPAVATVVVSLDHMTTNYIGDIGRDAIPWYVNGLHHLLLSDRLPAMLLLVALFATIVVEQWILRWAGKLDRFFPPIPLERLSTMFAVQPDPQTLQSAREYMRYRRAAHYAAWTWKSGSVPDVETGDGMARVLSYFALRAGASPGTSNDAGFTLDPLVPGPVPSE